MERCDRFNVSGLTILDSDLGLRLVDVTRSLFTGCLIRDDRGGTDARAVVIEGGGDNRLDPSWVP